MAFIKNIESLVHYFFFFGKTLLVRLITQAVTVTMIDLLLFYNDDVNLIVFIISFSIMLMPILLINCVSFFNNNGNLIDFILFNHVNFSMLLMVILLILCFSTMLILILFGKGS